MNKQVKQTEVNFNGKVFKLGDSVKWAASEVQGVITAVTNTSITVEWNIINNGGGERVLNRATWQYLIHLPKQSKDNMKDNVKNPKGIPVDYRVAECIEDFKAGDIVYWSWKNSSVEKGVVVQVDYYSKKVQISWSGSTYIYSHGIHVFNCIHIQEKQSKPTSVFLEGHRVRWLQKRAVGVVTGVTDKEIFIRWDGRMYSSAYLLEVYAGLLEVMPEVKAEVQPSVYSQKIRSGSPIQHENNKSDITLDLKLTLDFSTEGIRAVIMDCVQAVLKQEKYQEAKELCDLLINLKGLEDSNSNTTK